MSHLDGNVQTTAKVVCKFCGGQQFQYDRCVGCGGASLEVVDDKPVTDKQTHTVLLKQNLKTQNHMNLIGVVLAIGLVFVVYSVFKPDAVKPVSTDIAHTQKNYMLFEIPSEPLKVTGPSVSVGQIDHRNLATRKPVTKSTPPTVPETCVFDSIDLSDDFVVYAGRGIGNRLDYAIRGQKKLASQVDVTVNNTSKPVVLILDAAGQIIWNIKRTVGTEIKAIVFNGNGGAVIAGLDDSLPIFANTYQNDYPCGRFKAQPENIKVINSVSTALLGVEVEAVVKESRSHGIRFGAPVNYTHAYITDGVTADSYRDKSLPMARQAGLDQAVRNGLIRPATSADMKRWIGAASRMGYPLEKLNTLKNSFQHKSYLVVKPFTYPAGLYGGNSGNFFIEKGVPLPVGDAGHSGVYDINTGTCLSSMCRVILSEW